MMPRNDGPAPYPEMERDPEVLFPAPMTAKRRAEFAGWLRNMSADPKCSDVAAMLTALFVEVQCGRAAQQRVKALEADLFNMTSDVMVLDARLERLERSIEAARLMPQPVAFPEEVRGRPVVMLGQPVTLSYKDAGRVLNVRKEA